MSKFVIVKEAPKNLKQGELVISMPDFLDEIKLSSAKSSGKKLTAAHHTRQILGMISNSYDPNGDLNLYSSVPITKYEGLAFDTDEDLSAIVVRMLNERCPAMIDAALADKIVKRPAKTELIYFVGPEEKAQVFLKHGLALVSKKDSKTKEEDKV